MAWYTITHRCGHNERHQLTGNSRTREWRAGKLAEELCSFREEVQKVRQTNKDRLRRLVAEL